MGESVSRRAVIDIGTNSVKLLVGEASGSAVTPIHEESHQTRLGAGFYDSGHLQPSAIAQTAEAVARFRQAAARLGAAQPWVVATSAARDAKNSSDLIAAVRGASGLEMKVLSGAEEADWAFRGVTTDPKLARMSLMVLDIGGGSTEFIVGEDSAPHFAASYPLGGVRLMGVGGLEECRARIRSYLESNAMGAVKEALGRCRKRAELVCTGGTPAILGRMEAKMDVFDRERIEGIRLKFNWLRAQVEWLWGLTLEERQKIPGLPANRADVILTGSAILEGIMEVFGFEETRISTRGLRFWGILAQQ